MLRARHSGTSGSTFRWKGWSIAAIAIASADAALQWTIDYVQKRTAFGERIADFQNTQFAPLAEIATELDVTRAYVDKAILAQGAGTLTPVEAAKAKVVGHRCAEPGDRSHAPQLHGGYGYMMEYPIAGAFLDARAQRIYGGTNEIMKQIVAVVTSRAGLAGAGCDPQSPLTSPRRTRR